MLRLEARPKNIEGEGEIAIRELVRNALRMRPDRIIVGEVRGAEALDMLQAMNTGHDGSMSTVHANSPRDALHRIETMVLMAGYDLPVRAIRQQVSSALDLIVHLDRFEDGSRRVSHITEVQRMESDVITLQDLFEFKLESIAADRTITGGVKPTGLRPMFLHKFEQARHRAARQHLHRAARRDGRHREGSAVTMQANTGGSSARCRRTHHRRRSRRPHPAPGRAGPVRISEAPVSHFPDMAFNVSLPTQPDAHGLPGARHRERESGARRHASRSPAPTSPASCS